MVLCMRLRGIACSMACNQLFTREVITISSTQKKCSLNVSFRCANPSVETILDQTYTRALRHFPTLKIRR